MVNLHDYLSCEIDYTGDLTVRFFVLEEGKYFYINYPRTLAGIFCEHYIIEEQGVNSLNDIPIEISRDYSYCSNNVKFKNKIRSKEYKRKKRERQRRNKKINKYKNIRPIQEVNENKQAKEINEYELDDAESTGKKKKRKRKRKGNKNKKREKENKKKSKNEGTCYDGLNNLSIERNSIVAFIMFR
jgi:hypothetical protein